MEDINISEKQAKPAKKRRGKLDKSRALTLRLDNKLTYQEIADILKTETGQTISRQAIHEAISKLIPDKDVIDPFKNNRADILANVQAKQVIAYLSLTEDEQKDLIKKRGLVDMGIAFDKERLERGKSTDNILAVHAIVAKIDKLEADEKANGQTVGDG